jgi:TorA maturation chaperone TorD
MSRQVDPEQRALLREAAEWRMLGSLFECPSAGWLERIAALSPDVADARLKQAAQAAPREASEGMYQSLFGPGGPVPPREVSYRSGFELGRLMSELSGYYRAFCFAPGSTEPPDHVSVEANFVAYLKMKQAYALACADTNAAQITAEAARSFIDDHVSTLAQPVLQALEATAPPYLVMAGQALLDRAGHPKPTTANVAADPFGDPGEGIVCGNASSPSDDLIRLQP